MKRALSTLVEPDRRLPPELAALEISGIAADSREVAPGYLFAALAGTEADGTKFIPGAVEAGAVAVLAAEGAEGLRDCPVPVIGDADPRRALARMAARFFGAQPDTVVAVTGTNGKTSVASFVRQIWERLGHRSASLGTVGVTVAGHVTPLAHTTPEPVTLHRIIADLAGDGVTHLAMEASSHGLQQRRLDGLRFAAAAFTNISRDHLDYHPTFEDYFAQKLRLFDTLLSEGAGVVIDLDSPGADRVVEVAKSRGQRVLSVGRHGETLRLVGVDVDGFTQRLRVSHAGGETTVMLPLVGDFQVSNALVAAGLVIACGHQPGKALAALEHLQGALGRLEHVAMAPGGAPVFVDYAHTPDALATVLATLRPYAAGRLVVVFGCGGDRDRGKRPLMGAAAVDGADVVYVTDDNPRREEPAHIRAEVMAGAPGAREIAGRAEAIATAIAGLGARDVLLVAGKGHETGQIIGTVTHPFSDHDVIRGAIAEAAS